MARKTEWQGITKAYAKRVLRTRGFSLANINRAMEVAPTFPSGSYLVTGGDNSTIADVTIQGVDEWDVVILPESPLQREFEAGDPDGNVRRVADAVVAELKHEDAHVQHFGTCQICLAEDADAECEHGKPVHTRHGAHSAVDCGAEDDGPDRDVTWSRAAEIRATTRLHSRSWSASSSRPARPATATLRPAPSTGGAA